MMVGLCIVTEKYIYVCKKKKMMQKQLSHDTVHHVALVPRLYKMIRNLLFTRCTRMHDEGPVTVPVSKSVTAVHRVAITDSKTGRRRW